jgi:putative aldouronate transport system substrate-binding protein
VPFFTTKLNDMEGKVSYALDDPAYLDMIKKAKSFANTGIWSKGILASKNDNTKAFEAGKTPFIFNNPEYMITGTNLYNTKHPDWKVEACDLVPNKLHESSSGTRSGMGISATSKNAERAMLMLNLFGTNKEYYDLTTYGIKDVHYTPVGDNKLNSTELGLKNYVPKENCPWGWERKDFMRYPAGVPDKLLSLETTWIKNGLASKNPIVSFNFVDTNVKNEIAACDNLYQTKGLALLTGMSKDPETDLANLKADLKKAGIEKVQAELQKQVTAFLQSLK